MKRYRDNNINKTRKGWQWLMLVAVMLVGAQVAEAQVDFTQRSSVHFNPNDDKIYKIRGDFQLIGNTNMTLSNYSDGTNNSNNNMIYVDIDGDSQTLNSSSATLTFLEDTSNGVFPECSNILFAGLYWTGRAHNPGTLDSKISPHTFSVTKDTPGAGVPQNVNSNYNNIKNNENITNSYYKAVITREGSSGNYYYRYKLESSKGGQPIVIFEFRNNTPYIHYSTDMGNTWTAATGQSTTNSSNTRTTTFDPVTVLDEAGGITLKVSKLVRDSRTNNNSQTSTASISGTVTGIYRGTANITKTLDKSKVLLRHASKSAQYPVEAQVVKTSGTNWEKNIFFPYNTNDYMYSAYADVTNYVREHGVGEYFVSDIALREGNGGSVGYYGGWGMIIVYENPNMKWRDVTIFDGYHYISSGGGSRELPISGFHTAQTGDVNVKLGLIAGEGDVGITGDYFQILPHNKLTNYNNNDWVSLTHDGNSSTNFFNGSIPSDAPRNPNIKNNTGLDIAMFDIPNHSGTNRNRYIKNNQSETKFRYGTNSDTYMITAIAMAVDAYIPDLVAENSAISIGGSSSQTVLHPGEEIEFKTTIRNRGSESVENVKLEIPIPFNGAFVSATATHYYNNSGAVTGGYTPTNQPTIVNGVLTYNVGEIPRVGDQFSGNYQSISKDDVLVEVVYKIKATTNCGLLLNSDCNTFSLNGYISGKGKTSLSTFSNQRLITGYDSSDGRCQGLPYVDPINYEIDVDDYVFENCAGEDYTLELKFCNVNAIPLQEITEKFPPNSTIWKEVVFFYFDENGGEIEVDANFTGTKYVKGKSGKQITADIPSTEYEYDVLKTYYAIPAGYYVTCFWEFNILVEEYCGNYWVGYQDNKWSNQANWTVGLPGTTVGGKTIPNDVEFSTEFNNSINAINDLHVDAIDRVINNLINNSTKNLVIPAGNMLTITGTVTDTNGPNDGTIIVQADKDKATGTLLLDPSKVTNVAATVQFYNKAYTCDDCGTPNRQQWQYFGVPVKTINSFPYTTGNPETIFEWSEAAFGDKWITPTTALAAFRGYEINNSTLSAHNINPLTTIYNFAGTLNVGNATVPLTYTSTVNYKGWNLIGNSYTAAIPISADAISYSDDTNWEKNVYLFNTGSRNDWRKLSGNSVSGIESGRYTVVPIKVGGQAQLPNQIPSMHAFMVRLIGGTTGNLTLNYSKLTKNIADANNNQPAWRSSSKNAKLPYIVMDVIGTQSADRVWLFENMTTTRGFDAGWDGEKMAESGLMQLYVKSDDELKLQVATVPQLQGTTLGVKPDNNDNFKISFSVSSEVEARGLHLRDLITGRAYPIRNLAEYSVAGVSDEVADRFKVVTIANENMSKQELGNSIIEVFTVNNQIGITNNSDEKCMATIYDASGKMVVKIAVNEGVTQMIGGSYKINTGIYLVKVAGQTINESKRVMVK